MTMTAVLDNWLDPVITTEVARNLVALKADDRLSARVLELGQKSSEGALTADEQEEYDAYISANDVVAILQAKARQVLRRQVA
jgi:hypothetical protein